MMWLALYKALFGPTTCHKSSAGPKCHWLTYQLDSSIANSAIPKTFTRIFILLLSYLMTCSAVCFSLLRNKLQTSTKLWKRRKSYSSNGNRYLLFSLRLLLIFILFVARDAFRYFIVGQATEVGRRTKV